jgi:hypothetical protein|tara:strand:- start:131 stop:367 length:237 start_codon:yes stop_codon:yes gene_type:complete
MTWKDEIMKKEMFSTGHGNELFSVLDDIKEAYDFHMKRAEDGGEPHIKMAEMLKEAIHDTEDLLEVFRRIEKLFKDKF